MFEAIAGYIIGYFGRTKSIWFVIAVITTITVGLVSIIVTKKDDNAIEEMANRLLERELNLPKGSVNLDLPGFEKATK